jgi:hypothetical protein
LLSTGEKNKEEEEQRGEVKGEKGEEREGERGKEVSVKRSFLDENLLFPFFEEDEEAATVVEEAME